jgi:hypothetical protein
VSQYKIETPASEGRRALLPLFHQGDVQWENRFDGNATARTFVIGSYFSRAGKSRKKAPPTEDRRNTLKTLELAAPVVFPQSVENSVEDPVNNAAIFSN